MNVALVTEEYLKLTIRCIEREIATPGNYDAAFNRVDNELVNPSCTHSHGYVLEIVVNVGSKAIIGSHDALAKQLSENLRNRLHCILQLCNGEQLGSVFVGQMRHGHFRQLSNGINYGLPTKLKSLLSSVVDKTKG